MTFDLKFAYYVRDKNEARRAAAVEAGDDVATAFFNARLADINNQIASMI